MEDYLKKTIVTVLLSISVISLRSQTLFSLAFMEGLLIHLDTLMRNVMGVANTLVRKVMGVANTLLRKVMGGANTLMRNVMGVANTLLRKVMGVVNTLRNAFNIKARLL